MELMWIALATAFFGFMALMIFIAIISTEWGRLLFVILLLGMAAANMVHDPGKTEDTQDSEDTQDDDIYQQQNLEWEKGSGVTVSVNYDLSIAEAILAGKYGYVDDAITDENFPATRQGKADVYITSDCLTGAFSYENYIAKLKRWNLRPAELPELLAFGARFPNLQRMHPLIHFETILRQQDGSKYKCYLWADPDPKFKRRFVSLVKFDDKSYWNAYGCTTLFISVKLDN